MSRCAPTSSQFPGQHRDGFLPPSPPSRASPLAAELLLRSQRTPDADQLPGNRSGDESHSANLRRYIVNKRSLTNSSQQSGHRSGLSPSSTGSNGKSILAGEKRNNDGNVVRLSNQGSGRPSGAGYLSPCGLENVSFCSGSTGSNSHKSGSQSSYRSRTKSIDGKCPRPSEGEVTPEKRRKLDEANAAAAAELRVEGEVDAPREFRDDDDGGGGDGSCTSSKSPRTDTTIAAPAKIGQQPYNKEGDGLGNPIKGDEQTEQNPFSLLCPPSSDKLLLSGQSVARGTTHARRKVRGENRSCVSFDVNTAGRALLLKNGLDSSRKLHVLGRGGFGVVVKAVYQGQAVAVKIIPRHNKSQRSVESCLRAEMNAINLDHPNIVRAIRIFGFEERNALVIMELAGSISLQTMLNDHRTDIPFVARVKFGAQIAGALEFCHERRILHLDVKPSNILISGHETCKLGDFGCSRKLDDASRGSHGTCSVRGTVVYQAPEVLRGCMPTEKADIYSLGITMWQMITREYPFHGERAHVVMYLVGGRGKRPVMPHPGNQNEEFYMKLVEQCWKQNPIHRPSAADIQLIMRGWKDSLGNPLIV